MDPVEHVASQHPPVATLVADLVCPWCRLALHTLAPLLDRLGWSLAWHPFLLNPGLPPQGVPRRLYLERKFGTPEAAMAMLRRVARRGQVQGVAFAFERIERQPDTVAAHALLLEAAGAGRVVPLATALFRAFFEEGQDLSERATLRAAAATVGLAADAVEAAFSPDRQARVRAAHRRAVGRDIDGVPALLLPGLGVIAGAQPAEIFETFLETGLLARGRPAPVDDQGRQGS